LTPNELVLPFGGTYVCANFDQNRSRNVTVRVLTEGQIHRLTDANQFYNLSHAICYSYGTNKYENLGISNIISVISVVAYSSNNHRTALKYKYIDMNTFTTTFTHCYLSVYAEYLCHINTTHLFRHPNFLWLDRSQIKRRWFCNIN